MDLIHLSENLDDLQEYEALPDGLYPAEVRDVEIKHSEKTPGGYIVMSLKVDPSDFPADYDAANAPEGVVVTYAQVKLPDGVDRRKVGPFKTLLKALGEKGNANSFDPQNWIGKHVQVLLKANTYQGAAVNNVDAVSALPSV